MISYGTGSHLCVFTRWVFCKGSGTFLNAKSCLFGSIYFNGNSAEKHVLHFCCIFAAFCVLNLPSNKKKKKKKHKMHQRCGKTACA
ncbi:unnamed protein product [Staurois parvus]|uniref:Uncharacterized protein n=1 Tax=Staurois parvus TaxID=386267 RepID=A0ABN9BS60_9NEOB|nr:unnamed protein product [Staurois parvus]